MGKAILGAAILGIATTLSAPAAASDGTFLPPPYLQPEFSNYLSTPGPAQCAWYDHCWYKLVHPVEVVAPEPAQAVTPHRGRARRQ